MGRAETHLALPSAGGRRRRCGRLAILWQVRSRPGTRASPTAPRSIGSHGAVGFSEVPPEKRPLASPDVREPGRRLGRLRRPLLGHIPSRPGGDARVSGLGCQRRPGGTPPRARPAVAALQSPAAPQPLALALLALRLHLPTCESSQTRFARSVPQMANLTPM